ncbi:MAG TPA: hypothetical protein VNQ77_16200 [Frankiaceae bacterium]|nr:hypothetical protein [Frankiaceae bacterium]
MRAFTARRTVALLLVFLAYYLWVVGRLATRMLRDERLAFRGLGIGLLLLTLVGVLLAVAEIRFGLATQRLARDVGDLGDPDDFDAAQAAAEAAPEDWRAWYRLAVAYDAGRDPQRGRAAMRRAIALERAAR